MKSTFRELALRARMCTARGVRSSDFLRSGRNVVPGESGSCVRSKDVGFYKLYEDVREGVPFRSVLGEGFPLICGPSKFLCAESPEKL